MLFELNNKSKVVGLKQALRAVKQDAAESVFIAMDADKKFTAPILELCNQKNIPVEFADTMEQLGKSCGIEVGAAVVAVIHS